MEKVLTVVVPSYNVEKYIRQTLESLNHKAILEAIEVLVVDDGSSDDTAKIGKEYEEQYPRTYRVISKSNGGHGSTINCGIEQARGTFFKVVDGDDWVDTEAFVNVVEKLRRCQADYVITDYCEVYDNTGERVRKSFLELDSMEHREWSFQEIADLVQIPMHALIIRTSILKENKIRLDEHRFYVDVEYVLFPVPYVERVTYYPMCVYMYRLARISQSVSIQGYQKHMQDHMDVILRLIEFFESYRMKCDDTKKCAYIAKRIAQMIGDQITIFLSFPVENTEIRSIFQKFDQQVQEKSRKIYELSGAESGTLRVLRKTGFRGYRMIMKLGKRRNHMEE